MNRRQPNPFRPQSPVELSSPLASSSSTAGLLQAQGSPSNSPTPVPVIEPSRPLQEEPESMETRTPLVIPHAPHPVWDDTPSYDRPYDNPYYAQPIRDALWLPRDPTGLLDLDDTVDLLRAVTSEPSGGKIGTWGDEAFIGSSISSVLLASFGGFDEDDDLSGTPAVRTLNGSEIINLPSAIASRVENIDQESDVDHTSPKSKPSILVPPRRRQSSSSTNPSITFRRPSTLDVGANPAGFRSFSLGVEAIATAAFLSSTDTSSSDPRRRNRAATLDSGMGLRSPVRQLSSAHATRSLLSVAENPTSPRMSNPPTLSGNKSVISTSEAVVGEVIKEEKNLTQERKRQEEVEKHKADGRRSWWTSWIYSRGQ
ncbi:hypothetical protein NLI96_g8973 [Meripilus lineatus]|uniref:Uncharacterized protein n=1 Tax=Meripilus lineatus TaxID=2056292 RepID=A0AAD5YDG2_9APHY|nr:hypothetical protein NLI96_g8973 [Physisporinus lineatus]